MARNILFFSRKEFAVIVAIGLITGLMDDRVEMLQFASAARIHLVVLLNDYLAFKTGGPVFGDLLETWLEYGGVLAAFLVRKPAAGTLALTLNGLCQVFVNGTHDPHLLYGVPGLGADLVFALFRYRRYDLPAVCLAGVASAMFWYPIVWFTHGLYLYPDSFILADFAFRVLGSTVGDGLLAGALGLIILSLARRKGIAPSTPSAGNIDEAMRHANFPGFLIASLGVLLMVLTYTFSSVSNFFLSIAPDIPSGMPMLEEYNAGYVLGVLSIFLVVTMLAFRTFQSRYSG